MEIYMKMKDISLEGNLIDSGWIENLKYENGKTNLNAVMILSEIVYWYRPVEIRDESTGAVLGYKKKFKKDKLQKTYEALGERFGLSKRQAKLACDYLKEKGIITVEFRTIKAGDRTLPNVMFVEPVIEELKKITGVNRSVNVGYPTIECNTPNNSDGEPKKDKEEDSKKPSEHEGVSNGDTEECNISDNREEGILQQNVTYPTSECDTNTKIILENTNKDYMNIISTSENIHNDKNNKEDRKEKELINENVEYVEEMLEIQLNTKQKKIINALDIDKLKRSVLLTSTYENKSSIELYKILIAIYNNPNNHNLDTKSKSINHVVASNNKYQNGFNNFEPRDYVTGFAGMTHETLENKLLGWE